MRQFITKYGLYVAGGLLLLAVIIGYLANRSGNVSGTPMAYYIDELTGVESEQPADAVPPLPNKDGKPTLVRVVKFSCDNKKTVNVAYYEKYTDRAKQMIEQKDPNAADAAVRGLLVRLPEKDSRWVLQSSPEGGEITRRAHCETPKDLIFVGPPPR